MDKKLSDLRKIREWIDKQDARCAKGWSLTSSGSRQVLAALEAAMGMIHDRQKSAAIERCIWIRKSTSRILAILIPRL